MRVHPVLLYYANIVGYIRLALIGISVVCFIDSSPRLFVLTYALNAILDAVDGKLARKYNQISYFGSWFDVVLDNVGRSLLWCFVAPRIGTFVSCIEWLTFVCTHQNGARWKEEFGTAPNFAKQVMANGYKTPIGVVVIAGIHVLPIFYYGHLHGIDKLLFLPSIVSTAVLATLTAGRVYGMCVEFWVIKRHITQLINTSTPDIQ
eukprot:m.60242 g.60242  ORF g.60242 m.60242 type:complete len:205 (-) comp7933_c0_seq6:247-861(-)